MDIFPTGGYSVELPPLKEFNQDKNISTIDNIRDSWLAVGNALRNAMGIIDAEKDKE
ncbi:hypothetical protein MBAV_002448 [Candidatus Magnetobacterium bavaricum]|uniref:Uncharacterized protein n=1 Tax=Candidatus Magnetobacterium bavaricum TaxID=29290 RepID=A0A0F3GTS7_9BACT|nr:hypothetical protein MBAV_002448 [Candidatus Magnetobacterium bavaricum]